MPRIIGVDIPGDKPTLVALTYIHGIGFTTAKKIVEATGIDGAARSQKLTEDELSRIAAFVGTREFRAGNWASTRTRAG